VRLEPLPYHSRMRDFLKSQHRELWDWFASNESKSIYAEAVQLQLLKTTYRMERSGHGEMYGLVDEVLEVLDLEVPVTLYQSQEMRGITAALYFTPGHGHVVFGGDILKLLDQEERRALVGHELAHFKLWMIDGGEFLVTDRLLQTLANEPRASMGHMESARLWQLYTEIYADRGGAQMTEGGLAAISLLVKISTGLSEVDAASYVSQAEDIFAKESTTTDGISHPEPFIRARAMSLWSKEGASGVEEEVQEMIEGRLSFDSLDLLRQEDLTAATRRLIQHHLGAPWLRTGRVLSHAGHFFPKGLGEDQVDLEKVQADWAGADDKMRDYACYLLLDFACVDPDLEENGLAASFVTAESLGWADRLEELARTELKLLKRDVNRIRRAAADLVGRAATEEPEGEV
jgi:hypothetical protein